MFSFVYSSLLSPNRVFLVLLISSGKVTAQLRCGGPAYGDGDDDTTFNNTRTHIILFNIKTVEPKAQLPLDFVYKIVNSL